MRPIEPDDPARAAGVEVVARQARADGLRPDAIVCIPTFRRPEMLAACLASLARQQTARPFIVIVVDNDGRDRAGAAMAAAMMAQGDLPSRLSGDVLVEPRQGNCKAYNAAWRHARRNYPDTPFICGIDDDEEAVPGWLEALVATAEASGAGIVGGPVTPIFSDPSLNHLRRHPIFRSHYDTDGPVPQLYSSANYLIRADVIDAMGYPFLDEAFDYKGGGDTDFFTRARARGVRFHWSMAAAMTETMPPRRTEFSWIHARAVRNGMISALIAHKADPSLAGRLKTVAKSLALLAASPFRGIVAAARTGSPLVGLYHAQVAMGRIGAEFGLNIEQYRQPEKN
jgi:GT2 family glycosyltransferase